MEQKKILGALVLILLVSISFAYAEKITGSMGNARMILRLEQGETIEKHILVKNVNNLSLDIELSVSGELADGIELKETNFRLEPGQDKKAYFSLKALRLGTTETKINVMFIPVGGENGVGLSSTIIVIASEGDDSSDDSDDSDDSDSDDDLGSINFLGAIIGDNEDGSSNFGWIMLILLVIVLILMIVLSFILIRTKPKKDVLKE